MQIDDSDKHLSRENASMYESLDSDSNASLERDRQSLKQLWGRISSEEGMQIVEYSQNAECSIDKS
jgi:hypothetical protein